MIRQTGNPKRTINCHNRQFQTPCTVFIYFPLSCKYQKTEEMKSYLVPLSQHSAPLLSEGSPTSCFPVHGLVCHSRAPGCLGPFEQRVLSVQFECHYTIHSPLWLSLLVSSGWSALKPCGLVDRALCFGRGSRWPVRGRSHKWGSNGVPSRSPGKESGACSGISSSPSPTTCIDMDA